MPRRSRASARAEAGTSPPLVVMLSAAQRSRNISRGEGWRTTGRLPRDSSASLGMTMPAALVPTLPPPYHSRYPGEATNRCSAISSSGSSMPCSRSSASASSSSRSSASRAAHWTCSPHSTPPRKTAREWLPSGGSTGPSTSSTSASCGTRCNSTSGTPSSSRDRQRWASSVRRSPRASNSPVSPCSSAC